MLKVGEMTFSISRLRGKVVRSSCSLTLKMRHENQISNVSRTRSGCRHLVDVSLGAERIVCLVTNFLLQLMLLLNPEWLITCFTSKSCLSSDSSLPLLTVSSSLSFFLLTFRLFFNRTPARRFASQPVRVPEFNFVYIPSDFLPSLPLFTFHRPIIL